jgi:predicted Zn-dependent protease
VNGDNPELLGTMRQAFQILPRNHSIAGCYAISLARSGEPAKAALLFARVARMRPQESDNWLNLARAELDAGRPVESRAAAAKATALAPLQSLVLQFQAELEWRTGHFPASRDAVLRWRSIETNAANARFLADVEAVLASTNAVTPPR